MCAGRTFPGVETRKRSGEAVAWPGAQGPHRHGAHHDLRPRRAHAGARRADRRGAAWRSTSTTRWWPPPCARPGHDFELAVGFCFTDGLLAAAPVLGCRYCGTGSAVDTEFNVVSVDTGGPAPTATPRLGDDLVVVRPVRVDLARRAGRPARTADGHDDHPARGAGRGARPGPHPTGPVRHSPAPCTPPPRSTPRDGRWSSARTSAATTRSTRSSGACCSTGALPADRAGALRQRPGLVRDRAEGVGRRVRGAWWRSARRRRWRWPPPAGRAHPGRVRPRASAINVYAPERVRHRRAIRSPPRPPMQAPMRWRPPWSVREAGIASCGPSCG